MEIAYDKDFEKVMTELQTNFGWSNIEVLPDSYRDLLNDTIKAVKNCSIHDVSVSSTPISEQERMAAFKRFAERDSHLNDTDCWSFENGVMYAEGVHLYGDER